MASDAEKVMFSELLEPGSCLSSRDGGVVSGDAFGEFWKRSMLHALFFRNIQLIPCPKGFRHVCRFFQMPRLFFTTSAAEREQHMPFWDTSPHNITRGYAVRYRASSFFLQRLSLWAWHLHVANWPDWAAQAWRMGQER